MLLPRRPLSDAEGRTESYRVRSRSQVSCSGYRFASALSSMMIGQAIMGFAVVAFLMTVIFICSLLSCAGHIMCQRIVCRFKLAVPDYRLANALSSMMIGQ